MEANIEIKSVVWDCSKNKVAKIILKNGDECINGGGSFIEVEKPIITENADGKLVMNCKTNDAIIVYVKNTGKATVYSSPVAKTSGDVFKAYAVYPSAVASEIVEFIAE
ncbi:MAG: hypothetical protein MJ174_07415 [Treponema sp.]|nr:hypothetical protein [Treponema sp.]